eukprot:m.86911 g.86911  ORF g.86911 m.86911 type:complete len:600 (-) comp26016_c0_seq2:35-1834(-)
MGTIQTASVKMVMLITIFLLFVDDTNSLFLPQIFKDGVVLQHDAAQLFGYCDAGEKTVTVTVESKTGTKQVYSQPCVAGQWLIKICQKAPLSEATDLHISVAAMAADVQGGDSFSTPISFNATLGEVFLCSGQSNMVLSVGGASSGRNASQMLQNNTYPNIRLFSIITQNASTPQRDLPQFVDSHTTPCTWGWGPGRHVHTDLLVCQTWQTAQPGVTDYFSAECFYTAIALVDNGAIPSDRTIGLVFSAFSGTSMEAWSPPETFDGCPTYSDDHDGQSHSVSSVGGEDANANMGSVVRVTFPIPTAPSCLWNSMISPIVGFGLRAVIWNQGETNMGNSFERFSCVFQNMIVAWRTHWNIGNFSFMATQLGDQEAGPTDAFPAYIAAPRDAQLSILPGKGRTVNGGLVAAYDQGDRVDNPFGTYNVHSRFKQEIGRRMALVLANSFGLVNHTAPPVDWSGPVPTHAIARNGAIEIGWSVPTTHANDDGGGGDMRVLVNGTRDCWECCDGARALDTFQVASVFPGVNQSNHRHQVWVNTTFAFDSQSQTVTITPTLVAPTDTPYVVVRYAASLWPQCAIYSASNNVPALTFSNFNISMAIN